MKYILDANEMTTKENAHAYLKEQLELPEYYGMNLDALHDCLTDMENVEIEFIHMPEDKKAYVWKVWKVVSKSVEIAKFVE